MISDEISESGHGDDRDLLGRPRRELPRRHVQTITLFAYVCFHLKYLKLSLIEMKYLYFLRTEIHFFFETMLVLIDEQMISVKIIFYADR